jgi:hypothetical protein
MYYGDAMRLAADLRASRHWQSLLVYLRSRLFNWDILALAVLLTFVFLISRPNLFSPDIDDLDSAHHLMDGYFFRDLIVDHPFGHLPSYTVNYYKQYPALGFIFWPPLFPLVLGLFCLVGGAHVLTARMCIAFFGVMFSFAIYAILRRRLSVWLSLCATIAAITMPGIAWSYNEVMLELPAIAMMCLAVLAYFSVVDHLDERSSIWRGLLCGVCCAAVIYTKQPAWFLFPALGLDFLLLHRRFLRKLEVVIAIVATFVLCAPLTFFTFTYGRANFAQAVLDDPRLSRVLHNAFSPRWSFAAWAFYPKLAASSVNPAIVFLVVGVIVLAVLNRHYIREQTLWLGWFFFAYLTLSYYDNRQARFATFWWPCWVVLAAAFLAVIMNRMPRKWAWILPLFLLLPVPWQMREVWQTDFTDYRQVQPPIAALFESGNTGDILVFGQDKQVLVALVREHDLGRTVHLIRGDRLVRDGQKVADICRRYRIGTVLVTLSGPDSWDQMADVSSPFLFTPIEHNLYFKRGMMIRLLAFHYHGPVDENAAEVSLSHDLL